MLSGVVSFILFSTTAHAYDPTTSGITYAQTADSMIYTNTPNVNIGAITNAFNTIPAPLRELFRREGVKLYFTAGVPMSVRSAYGITKTPIVSYYEKSNKVVSVDSRAAIYIYDDANINSTLPHEYGHALDGIAGYITNKYIGERGISSSTEWNTLYTKNFAALGSIDGSINYNIQKGAAEAFADTFRLYCTNPTALQNACPEVYNFVAAQINKYAGGGGSTEVTKKTFDSQAYAEMYPDVKAALGTDKDALWNHYVNYGKKEGRTAPRVGQ